LESPALTRLSNQTLRLTDSKSFLFLQSVLLLVLSWALIGSYYGWLDDVQLVNFYRGILASGPMKDPFYNVGLADVYIFLYGHFSNIPWYGIANYSFVFLGLYNLLFSLKTITKATHANVWIWLLLSLLFFVIHVMEMVVYLNFTNTAILLAVSSTFVLFSILKESVSKAHQAVSLIGVCVALLIRYEVACFAIVMVLFYQFVLEQGDKWSNIVSVKWLFLIVSSLLILVPLASKRNDTEDFQSMKKLEPYLFAIQDAYTFNWPQRELAERDSMKFMAVYGWNYYDDAEIDENYLKQISVPDLWQRFNLQTIRMKLNLAFNMASRYESHYKALNWLWKNINILLLNIGLSLLISYLHYRDWRKINLWLFAVHLLFLVTILSVFVYAKAENRFVYPMMLVMSLFTIRQLFIGKSIGKLRYLSGFVFLVMGMISAVQLKSLNVYGNERIKDLSIAKKATAELNTIENQTVVIDMHMLWLLHGTPLSEARIDPDIPLLLLDYPMRHYSRIQKSYEQRCGTYSFIDAIECLVRQPDKYLFAFADFDMDFLISYLRIVHGKCVVAEKQQQPQHLQHVERNFLWEPIRFNYFRLTDCSKK